ncbi:hypothetical protein K461DRAFT_265282 [Myriangium duriaei CBS 260.36]|uniref:Flavin-nucleotide-binding protein n=1 Tax=Myriangium duriaei CBS 260.36 TaxID=1168546 RepID=A0A9P4JB53_9PEZI|nr:hypothetical protein K461DRAFT_265282 [Myriangium duriaei CBS 260.36]
MTTTYPVDERTKANRYNSRTTYDAPLIHSILSTVPVVHVAFTAPLSPSQSPSFPSILPMLAALAPSPASPTDQTVLYLHGSSTARLSTLCSSDPQGLPVTISAAHVDGYVLSLSPFSNSVNFRSAVVFGRATLVTDEAEIASALEVITDGIVPGRWGHSRVPPTKSEIRQTGVLRVEIEAGSAKVRSGGPHSERRDLRDEEVRGRVWTGVVPMWEVLGEPVASGDNEVESVPGYIAGWVRGENAKKQGYAEGAAVEE